MNQYEELIYSLIANCNREITKEEKKILNQASAIYNTYNNLTDELGCPLEVAFKALEIIKNKTVVIRVIKCCKTVEMYNTFAFDEEYFKDKDYARKLTEEEFSLLKEVLE